MLTTPLHHRHLELGARMAPFAGYDMPISYTSLREEHEAVREGVGVFDVSHMGEFVIRGREALDLVQYVTSNDASRLEVGQAQYSTLPTPEGGIVDDLLVYRLPEDRCAAGERAYMLVVNAANIGRDWEWIAEHNRFDTAVIDISEQTALLAVQGPRAAEALRGLTTLDLAGMPYYTFAKAAFAGVENVLVSATGYTGAGGFEVYVPAEHAVAVWDAILARDQAGGPDAVRVAPVGLGARDSLRLEAGYALYGNELDLTTSTLEAGLGWVTKLDKGDFVGARFLRKQKEEGLRRRLVGIRIDDRRVARHGYPIVDEAGAKIGEVTSGSQSPTLGYPVALGYVPYALRKPGTPVRIDAGRKVLAGEVARVPFVGRG